jgi:hypothetical protein
MVNGSELCDLLEGPSKFVVRGDPTVFTDTVFSDSMISSPILLRRKNGAAEEIPGSSPEALGIAKLLHLPRGKTAKQDQWELFNG